MRRSRCGFVLLEILAVITLMAVLGLISARLSTSVIKLMGQTGLNHTRAIRIDSAIRELRFDCWSAQSMSAAATNLNLTLPDNRQVAWTILPDGNLERREGQSTRAYPLAISGATFRVERSAASLSVPDTRQMRGGEVQFPSQLSLAARETP